MLICVFLPGSVLLLMRPTLPVQTPTVVAHSSAARPVLSDVASTAGMIHFKGTYLELDVTFNCQYRDLVMITITIPVEPSGNVLFTIPKQCGGPDPPRGTAIAGLDVRKVRRACRDQAYADDDAAPDPAPDVNIDGEVSSADGSENAGTASDAVSSDGSPAKRLDDAGLPSSSSPASSFM